MNLFKSLPEAPPIFYKYIESRAKAETCPRFFETYSIKLLYKKIPANILQGSQSLGFPGDSGAARTRDPQLRRLLLYPTELRNRMCAKRLSEPDLAVIGEQK